MVIVLVYVRLYCVTTVTSSYEGSYKYYCVTTVTFSSEESYCGTRGVLNKVLYGEGPPRGPTPYPFVYHSGPKRYPFRIPSIDKWYPFYLPSLELCIPFNCCKSNVF